MAACATKSNLIVEQRTEESAMENNMQTDLTTQKAPFCDACVQLLNMNEFYLPIPFRCTAPDDQQVQDLESK
jgi:hypothetical protein